MNSKAFLDAMGGIDSKYIEEAAVYRQKRQAVAWGKVIALAACIVFVLALTIPTLTRQTQTIVTENEPKLELTLSEAINHKTFGGQFPQQLLEGYVLQGTPGIYDNRVLQAAFINEQLGDEMIIRIASKEWFHSHEPESRQLNTVQYRATLHGTGSYIFFEGGENIISYSFSTRDIGKIDGFQDMVHSAEQISNYSGD